MSASLLWNADLTLDFHGGSSVYVRIGTHSDRPAILLGIIPLHTLQFADVDFDATTVKPLALTWI